jgi:hypothetical protein
MKELVSATTLQGYLLADESLRRVRERQTAEKATARQAQREAIRVRREGLKQLGMTEAQLVESILAGVRPRTLARILAVHAGFPVTLTGDPDGPLPLQFQIAPEQYRPEEQQLMARVQADYARSGTAAERQAALDTTHEAMMLFYRLHDIDLPGGPDGPNRVSPCPCWCCADDHDDEGSR